MDGFTRRVLYVDRDTSINDCMNLMTAKRIRHLPVIDAGKILGVISMGDVVKVLLKNQEESLAQQAFEIAQLERYISGGVV